MKRVRLKQTVLGLVITAFVFLSYQAMPVAAIWSGSFSDPFEYGDDGESTYVPTSYATESVGTCEVRITQRAFLSSYATGANGWAWVGSDLEMDETVTALWCMSVTWNLDYRIASVNDFPWDTGNEIKLEVIYQVYNSQGAKLQEKVAWSELYQAKTYWDDVEGQIDRTIEKTFGVNLYNNYAYTFRVMLKVTILDAGWMYQCSASSDTGEHAILTVEEIDFYVP
ncbi:MAG: hypothetical protein P1Q69_03685 [Candidatus Thorarchaeota archaeon]|nr:hypothetical protein [Candidatus Thorarchaeota archaeon]